QNIDKLFKIYGTAATPADVAAMYEDLMQGLSELSFLSGYCYTQLVDVEQEINGLLTYDRRPK
ncbi:hypothetical protein CYG49_01655, partial [Candidatus Saccharibacteria bacterium]